MTLDADSIGKFVALGGTFQSHQDEKNRTYRWPDFWAYPKECIINEGRAIEIPAKTDQIKPGAELTAVIGDEIWQADEDEAWDAIKGFTVSNDVTASGDWPGWSDPDHGMITGVGYKCFPTFAPILSEFVERGNQTDYEDLDVEILVDGETSVKGSTAEMAFSIPEMVSFASNITPLRDGDAVALGDPGSPTITLDDAEEVVCKIESVGELTNSIDRLPK